MKKIPKSLSKYIRREKARIRRDSLNSEKRKTAVEDLYDKILKKRENKN